MHTHSRVKQATSDAIKCPRIGHQAHAKHERDKDGRRCPLRDGRCLGQLGARKGKKEEEEGADKFAKGGDDVVLHPLWCDSSSERHRAGSCVTGSDSAGAAVTRGDGARVGRGGAVAGGGREVADAGAGRV